MPKNQWNEKPTGRQVLSASWQMLRTDKQLLWLPVLSVVSSAIAGAALFYPGFLAGHAVAHTQGAAFWTGGALATFGASAAGIYFQAALVVGAYQRAEGIQPSLRGVLAATWKLRGPVLSWALLTTTVGLAIRALEERLGWLGTLLGVLGGLTWAAVSFLVVPVVVAEGLGPVEALKRSAQLLRDTWGTSLRTTLRFGLVQIAAMLPLIAGLVLGAVMVAPGTEPQRSVGIVILAISIVGFLVVATVFAAISTYARALIYRHAAGLAVPGLPGEAFAGAFVPKKRRRR